jgi:hypothetical protein
MHREQKVLLGAATLWPGIYSVTYLLFWLWLVLSSLIGRPPRVDLRPVLALFFVLDLLAKGSVVALLGYYVPHLFRTDRVPADHKALWGVVLLLGSVVSMPVYWYLYIWQGPEPDPNHNLPRVNTARAGEPDGDSDGEAEVTEEETF